MRIPIDQTPAHGEIRIIRWQFHHVMQMFREYDPGMNHKGVTTFDLTYRFTQFCDISDHQVIVMSLQQINREEIGTARMPGSSIVRHVRSIVINLTFGAIPCGYCALHGLPLLGIFAKLTKNL